MSWGSSLEVATFIYALLKFEAGKQASLVAILCQREKRRGHQEAEAGQLSLIKYPFTIMLYSVI